MRLFTLLMVFLLTITMPIFATLTNMVSFQSTAIDFTQVQQVPLILTAANERFIVRSVAIHCDSYVGVTTPAVHGSWGWTSPDYNEMGYTNMPIYDANQYYIYSSGFENTIQSIPASTQMYFNLITPGAGTSFTGKVIVMGFFD